MKFFAALPLVAIGIATFSTPNDSAFRGWVWVTECTVDMDGMFSVIGEDAHPIELLTRRRAELCSAGEVTETLIKVRDNTIHMTMPEGEMSVDYTDGKNPTFTMYNPRANAHAIWTMKDFAEMRDQMMGGQRGGAGVAEMLKKARDAAGAPDEEAKAPTRSPVSVDCAGGERWRGSKGTMDLDGNPLADRWVVDICITKKYPEAYETYLAMQQAVSQFDMEEQDDQEKMEEEIAKRGFPEEIRVLSQGGGFTSSNLELTIQHHRVEERDVTAEDVNAAKGERKTMQELLMSGMQ